MSEKRSPTDFLLQFFVYDHLPDHLAVVSKPFADLASEICNLVPDNPEKTVALRKLLEAKDCAVRAVVAERSKTGDTDEKA